jgi:oligopeptide/dipeptide ABC transporter ATP-binding protein
MIFQEPNASFNLLFSVGYQIGEALRLHKKFDKKKAIKHAGVLLDQVHIPEAKKRAGDYPFQMSGGMLQRVMIAQALSCAPSILLADEPTTALDVTIQAQILGLLKEKADQTGMSIIFVTHDLALIEDFADTILIMYAGRIFEYAKSDDVFFKPLHPYTQDLLKAIPRLGIFKDQERLFSIKGKVPELDNLPKGCKYAPRCQQCMDICLEKEPELKDINNHKVRCWLFAEKKE